jgi:xanthine/uracil permease
LSLPLAFRLAIMAAMRLPTLRLPPGPPRRRPPDLTYAADETPPWASVVPLSIQHALTALSLTVYILAAARIAGMSPGDTRSFVAVSILTMAVATFLQACGGRLGAGMLLVHIPAPVLLVLSANMIKDHGPGAMVPIALTAGAAGLLVARCAPHLRKVFTAPVVGLVVTMVGLSLIAPSITHSLGMGADHEVAMGSLGVAALTLGVIVAGSIWGNRAVKLFALIGGIAAGTLAAALTGQLGDSALLAAEPFLAVPTIATPVFKVPVGVLLAVAMITVLTHLDTLGSVIIMQKMDDANWRRADMRNVGRGIQASSVGDLLTALLGSYPSATSSANIALCHVSRSTARVVGIGTALVLLVVVFMPQVTMALTLIPTPVLGAVEIYAAAYLIVSGIELIASRALDSRGIFMVGLSVIAGLGVMLVPQLAERAPESVRFLAGSGFVVAGATAIVLTLLFRIGLARRQVQPIVADGPPIAEQVADFVAQQGGAWAARREVVQRATLAAVEAAEAIQAMPGHALRSIRGSFDELSLDLTLNHDGAPLALGDTARPDLRQLLDADDAALDAAFSGVSMQLLRHLSDRVTTGRDGDGSGWLRLHFEH